MNGSPPTGTTLGSPDSSGAIHSREGDPANLRGAKPWPLNRLSQLSEVDGQRSAANPSRNGRIRSVMPGPSLGVRAVLHHGDDTEHAQQDRNSLLPVHFAPRSYVPTIMINGSQVFIRPIETSVQPMFALLGTAPSDKKLELFPLGHLPPI